MFYFFFLVGFFFFVFYHSVEKYIEIIFSRVYIKNLMLYTPHKMEGNSMPLLTELKQEQKDLHKLECSDWKRKLYSECLDRIELDLKEDKFSPIAYTQTFKPSGHCNMPFSYQHDYKSMDIHYYLNDIVNFFICPEATEEGNIHYHGVIINIKNRKKKKWYEKTLPQLKNLGYIKFKPMKSIHNWVFNYCLKHCDDFTYMKNNYLMYNYTIKHVPQESINNLDKGLSDSEDEDDKVFIQTVRRKNNYITLDKLFFEAKVKGLRKKL